jgi:hypothetical protein
MTSVKKLWNRPKVYRTVPPHSNKNWQLICPNYAYSKLGLLQDSLFDKPALGSAAKLCISNCLQPLHCLMFLESDWHMIIGGWNDDYMDGLTSVELFNWRTGEQCLLTNGNQ